jgi:hypothetical protein
MLSHLCPPFGYNEQTKIQLRQKTFRSNPHPGGPGQRMMKAGALKNGHDRAFIEKIFG